MGLGTGVVTLSPSTRRRCLSVTQGKGTEPVLPAPGKRAAVHKPTTPVPSPQREPPAPKPKPGADGRQRVPGRTPGQRGVNGAAGGGFRVSWLLQPNWKGEAGKGQRLLRPRRTWGAAARRRAGTGVPGHPGPCPGAAAVPAHRGALG